MSVIYLVMYGTTLIMIWCYIGILSLWKVVGNGADKKVYSLYHSTECSFKSCRAVKGIEEKTKRKYIKVRKSID